MVKGNDYKEIWVFAEARDGKLNNVGFELLGKGRELADVLRTGLSAVCFGDNISGIEQLVTAGADKVYLVADPSLNQHQEDLYTGELLRLIREYQPEIVLAGATALGRSFIPRVAAALKTGLTADCIELAIDPESQLLLQTCTGFGGNVLATIVCPERRPQMATVRPRVFRRNPPNAGRSGEIIKLDFDKEGIISRTRLLGFVEDETETVKIEDADIIVAGGRGLEKAENFRLVEELAQVMGAAVAATRPPVDEGWIGYSRQVGQTGKTVSPKLFIACGISGAVQHTVGMQTAGVIVAINNDPDALIFDVATYGIVGDLFEIVPLLIQKLKG